MDYFNLSNRLELSYYKTIATLNDKHKVYLVQHQETQKIYVKKILDVYNKDIYMRLSKEHIKGIPQIIALYEDNDQLIVIENYVSGLTLQELIASSSINIDFIFQYILELCTILEKVHSFEPAIIHRDIKPSNIIITEHNHVMLLDFNAAKFFSENSEEDTVLLGTKGYAAPEQYGFGSSTPRTDIYALGILIKEMTSSAKIKSGILENISQKCIQINPLDRYQSVSELKDTLVQTSYSNNANIHTETNIHKNILSYFPPGFRTLTPWKMIISSMFYMILIMFFFTVNIENTFGLALWIYRFLYTLLLLSIVLVTFNYLDIQRLFPMCNHKNRFVRYTGIILFDIVIIVLCAIIAIFIQNVFLM